FASEGIDEEANITLSIQRAQAVVIELMKYGIDRTKIRIEFFGSQNPRFPTGTPEGNVKNQRVEIDIVE
ncbi:MAG: OmpA family protein, partial [Elusimicrobiota bacterium]|nr:OmpA family protein [Elusimicrobiota bacterium]